jgi:hypothetical protein
VHACCITGRPLGDLKKQAWEDIWNGAPYRSLRRTVHGWNPTAVCRRCGFGLGISGGDELYYSRFFSRFRGEEVSLDAPELVFGEGFHALEYGADGTPTHRWMAREGSLVLPMRTGAKFLRLRIAEDCPFETVNGGSWQINGGPEEYFDNTCPDLHFPISQVEGEAIRLQLRMEQAGKFGEDPRELALALRGVAYLF